MKVLITLTVLAIILAACSSVKSTVPVSKPADTAHPAQN